MKLRQNWSRPLLGWRSPFTAKAERWKWEKAIKMRQNRSKWVRDKTDRGSGLFLGRKVKSSWFSCRVQLFKTAALKIWQQTPENTKKNFGWRRIKAFLILNMKKKPEALNFLPFFTLPPPLLWEVETTFNQLSNAKSLQNICCNRWSVESLLLQIIFGSGGLLGWDSRQLLSFHWNIGKLGEEGLPGLRLGI